jgi:hypothetical protein
MRTTRLRTVIARVTVRARRPVRTLQIVATLIVAMMATALPATAIEGNTVVLQGLDKVTARISTFEAPVGEEVRFGTLQIHAQFCDRRPPEEPPEVAAFLDIYEARLNEDRKALFHGWMFASSPALNALEHPVYDVWVLGCKTIEVKQTPGDSQPNSPAGEK